PLPSSVLLCIIYLGLFSCSYFFFFFSLRLSPISSLFPYTTLFRSETKAVAEGVVHLTLRALVGQIVQVALRVRHLQVDGGGQIRSEEHTSELQSRFDLVCRLLLEKKKRHT